jgi:hypothetical protein
MALGRGEKVLERDMKERSPSLGEDLVAVPELTVDPDPPAAAVVDPGSHAKRAVDEHGPPVADEDSRRHGREAVPRGQQAGRLVEGGADEPAMRDPGRGLVPLREGEVGLVALDSLLGRKREVDAIRIVPAAPARRVMMGRNSRLYRSPPRSKCAL